MKSLIDSFIPPPRTNETFHYPGYVIRLQKERRIQAKRKTIARKNLHENDVPDNIKLLIKNIENIRLRFNKVKNL